VRQLAVGVARKHHQVIGDHRHHVGLSLSDSVRLVSCLVRMPKCKHQSSRDPASSNGWGGRIRTFECRNQNPVP
jgi:hypothetical protein